MVYVVHLHGFADNTSQRSLVPAFSVILSVDKDDVRENERMKLTVLAK